MQLYIAWLCESVKLQTCQKVVINLESNLESNSFGQFISKN